MYNFSSSSNSDDEVKSKPPSGKWSGFYIQHGQRNHFNMHLSFSSSSVHGQCTDSKENSSLGGDVSDITGTWQRLGKKQVCIHFEKRYRGSHGVDYQGYYYTSHGRKRITGTYFDGSDTFEMYYEEEKE